jgi:hypothetical protein
MGFNSGFKGLIEGCCQVAGISATFEIVLNDLMNIMLLPALQTVVNFSG